MKIDKYINKKSEEERKRRGAREREDEVGKGKEWKRKRIQKFGKERKQIKKKILFMTRKIFLKTINFESSLCGEKVQILS